MVVPFFASFFRLSRQNPKTIKAAPATAEATPAAIGTIFDAPCVVPDDEVRKEAGAGAGVGADGAAGVAGRAVAKGAGVGSGEDIRPAAGEGAGVGVGDDSGVAGDVGAVVEEGESKALVLSITAT